MLANLDGFWIFHSQLTSPIPPFETYHKLGLGCACGLIGLGVFFSSLVALIVALWSTSIVLQPALTSFRPCLEPSLHLMEFPWASSSSFLLAKVVQVGADEKGHNLSHLLAKGKP